MSHPPQPDRHVEIPDPPSDEPCVKMDEEMAACPPSGETGQYFPRFFDLPRELRDMVYEFVLTADGVLDLFRYDTGKIILYDSLVGCWPTFHEFNQLQYASRQLYAETSGLELKYNSIVFWPESGLEDLDEFLQIAAVPLTPARGHNLKTIWINTCGSQFTWTELPAGEPSGFLVWDESVMGISGLVNFCRSHPEYTVRWIIGDFNYINERTATSFLEYGNALYALFRDADDIPEELRGLNDYLNYMSQERISRAREQILGDEKKPVNLKIMPEQGRHQRFTVVRRIPDVRDVEHKWQKIIQDWHRNGI